MIKLEIERRWLLKGIPEGLGQPKYEIHQFYGVDEIGNFRVRNCFQIAEKDYRFYLTRKKFISEGVFEEDETEITLHEFSKAFIKCTKGIHKMRYEFLDQNLKFEIDEVITRPFIFLEVELDSIDQSFKMPTFIQDKIIKEITGNNELSNSRLSAPLKL